MSKYILKAFLMIELMFWSVIGYAKLRCVGKVGRRFRAEGPIYLAAIGGSLSIGDDARFGAGVKVGVAKGGEIIIGNAVSVNQGSHIIAVKKITIGCDSRIGEYVSIRDNDHEWRNPAIVIRRQGFVASPVTVGQDVWIGRGVSVQKGVNIGDGAVVGANAVVTKDVQPFSVSVGVPARSISYRGTSEA